MVCVGVAPLFSMYIHGLCGCFWDDVYIMASQTSPCMQYMWVIPPKTSFANFLQRGSLLYSMYITLYTMVIAQP